MRFYCDYCGNNFKTPGGLRQHIDGKAECRAKEKERAGLIDLSTLQQKSPAFASIPKRTHEDTDPCQDFDLKAIDDLLGLSKSKRQRKFAGIKGRETDEAMQAKGVKLFTTLASKHIRAILDKCEVRKAFSAEDSEEMPSWEEQQPQELDEATSEEDELMIVGGGLEDYDDVSVHSVDVSVNSAVPLPDPHEVQGRDYNNDHQINIKPNTQMRDNFRKFCFDSQRDKHNTYTKSKKRAVRLMGVLKGTRAALNTYDAILEWHHRENGDAHWQKRIPETCSCE